jgi:hypothetical protein
MTRKLFRSCLTGLAIATFACPAFAQSNTTVGGPNAANDAQLRQQFAEGFNKGCLAGKTPGVSNQVGFCSCMAKAYTTRYNGRVLAVISQLAGSAGKSGPPLVDAMMAPERLSCINKSGNRR